MPITPSALATRYRALQERIRALTASRPPTQPAACLLAVSKGQDFAAIAELAALGQRDFGENYLQEALPKIAAAKNSGLALTWHFIGPLQSNKSAAIATHFDWVHSVARADIARRLSQQRAANLPPLRVLLQINSSGEASKSGVRPADALALAQEISQLPKLQLRGLMTIAAPLVNVAAQEHLQKEFSTLRALQQQLQALAIPCPELSMGMSADMELALAAGSTWLRIGSALFGARLPTA